MRRHLGGGALASTVSQVAVLGTTAIASVIIARILGPSGTGGFALAANFIGVAMLVAGVGIKQGVVFYVGSGRWGARRAIADLALPVALLGVAGAALALGVYELTRDSALDGLPEGAAFALIAALPLALVWQLCNNLVLALERYEAYAVLYTLPSLLTLAICPALAAISGTSAAIAGFAAAQAIAGAVAIWWAWRSSREAAEGSVAWEESRSGRLRDVRRFGLRSWSAELLQFVNFRFDLFFLGAYAATSDVGVYSVAATVTTIAIVLPQALSIAVQPRAAALEGASIRGEVSSGDVDLSDSRAVRHTLLLMPVSAAVVAVLVVVGIPFLYGSRFDDAVGLGLILLPGVLALGLAKVLSAILIGRGHPGMTLIAALITVPPTVAGYLIVIPDHGAEGAAIVSAASYALTAMVSYVLLRVATGLRGRDFIPQREDVQAYGDVIRLASDYALTLGGRRKRG